MTRERGSKSATPLSFLPGGEAARLPAARGRACRGQPKEAIIRSRPFGRTGWKVSEIGFGAWAIGGSWGEVSERDAEAALTAALDHGVTFVDTADVYGN